MRSFIEDKIKDIGVEAFQEPPVVKYYKPSTLHNMTLSDECLDQKPLRIHEICRGSTQMQGQQNQR